MIDLYTWPTPNGHKVQIMLEETGLSYTTHAVDITEGAQFDSAYLAINPNNKVPSIVDRDGPDGMPYPVFETGAILLYLAEKTGQFLPDAPARRYDVIQWLMWQMGGLGPILGQAQHFHQYAPEKVPYGIERYSRESYRLLGVMERRLAAGEYLVDDYSIADMACFPWIRIHKLAGLSLDGYDNIVRWYGAIRARPAVGRGIALLIDQWKDISKTDSAKHQLFGDPQYEDRQ